MWKLVATSKISLRPLPWTPRTIFSVPTARGGPHDNHCGHDGNVDVDHDDDDDGNGNDVDGNDDDGVDGDGDVNEAKCDQVCGSSRRETHSQMQRHQEQQEALVPTLNLYPDPWS